MSHTLTHDYLCII